MAASSLLLSTHFPRCGCNRDLTNETSDLVTYPQPVPGAPLFQDSRQLGGVGEWDLRAEASHSQDVEIRKTLAYAVGEASMLIL